MILEAVVVGQGEQGEVRSGQIQVPFNPAPVSDVSETKLTNEEPSVSVMLQGTSQILTQLEVSVFFLFINKVFTDCSLSSVDNSYRQFMFLK